MQPSIPQRTALPPRWRVAAAFLMVPALAALSIAIAMPLYSGLPSMTERIWKSALAYGVFGAYPPTIIFGIPAYLVLRKHFKPRLINCAFVGAFVAALPWALLALASTPDQASIDDRATVIDGSKTAFGWLMDAQALAQIALFGALGGFLFWARAIAGSGAEKVFYEED